LIRAWATPASRALLLVTGATLSCALVTPLDEHEYTGGSGSVTVVLDDSACVLADASCQERVASVVEVGTYPGACPEADASADDRTPIASLLAATPDADERVSGGASIPPLRQPAPGRRAYFALLRDARCGVVGWGCTDVDYTNQSEVTIAERPAGTPPLGACFGGACACSTIESDASTDAPVDGAPDGGCSLSLVSAGALPPPVQSSDSVAGPSIAPTGSGFVIALREQWRTASGLSSALRTVVLNPDGSLASPSSVPLSFYDRNCALPIADDGVGAAFDATKGGLFAVSLPACGDSGAGATFVPFSGAGAPTPPGFPAAGPFLELQLASAHSLAPSYATGDFELTYVSPPSAFDAIVAGAKLESATQLASGDPATSATFAALAATPSLRTQVIGMQGGDAGLLARVYAGMPGNAPQLSATLPRARMAGVAVSSAGAAVAGLTDQGLAWQTLDGSGHALAMGGFAGSFTAVDVAATGDLAAPFVVIGASAGEITMAPIDSMAQVVGPRAALSANPVLRELLASFAGNNVSVGGGQGLVAVVWLTNHQLGDADPTGGFALFACP
jgi:hypothetical protein